ncbi:MAG: HesA/MoeB/ThiF family protein [Candidatus Njordarchaeales archaeon]
MEKERLPPMLERVKRAGVNPELLHSKTVCVFGVGGLGAIVAEMLARIGIGRIIIVDRDIVGPENLNRLGYDVEDVGKPKVEALAKKLSKLARVMNDFSPTIEAYYADVIAWEKLPEIIEKCDLIFTCFDNIEARLEINYWAVKLRKPLIDGGTSTDGLGGRIITVIPYDTPCLGCYFGSGTMLKLEEGENISGSCDASIPTTMSIVAALQVDSGLKLLHEKKVAPRIIISLREDEMIVFQDYNVKRRRDCEYCGGKEP